MAGLTVIPQLVARPGFMRIICVDFQVDKIGQVATLCSGKGQVESS